MRDLRGKRVLITGAAAGIGRALSLRLARDGAHLYLLDIDEAGLSTVVRQAASMGVQAYGRRCDVSQRAQVSASIDAMLRRWGTLDVLVNNAGVCYYGPTVKMTAQQWNWVMSVNLLAPIQFIQELLPTLLARPEAHLLNVASLYGLVTTPRSVAYHASKFGLVGLSEALRTEFRRQGLGVTAVCPGFVTTDFFAHMASGRSDGTIPQPPRWLCTTPERVAEKAVRAIRRDQRLVMVTPLAYGVYYLKRWAPWLLDWAAGWGRRQALRKKRLRLAVAEPNLDEMIVPFPSIEQAPSQDGRWSEAA